MLFIRQYQIISIVNFLAFCSSNTSARKWRDSGAGTIVLEEAWVIPELLPEISAAFGGISAELAANLLDIHDQRLSGMNKNNIDYMVLSCAQPCIQGISDPDEAAAMAITVNNRLAESISNNTERFGGFASVAMHNATVAALELKRAIQELGFLGLLLNDYQQSGLNNDTLFYDTPDYDVFWQMVTDLNVPVYFHPRTNLAPITSLLYKHAPYLEGPAQEYAVTLSTHVLGLCTNGVFEYVLNESISLASAQAFTQSFPKTADNCRTYGERIPSDLVRIDGQLKRQTLLGMPMQRNITSYWRTNIFETTSGNFATDLLQFHINEIGLDRIMYSIDYPYVVMEEGTAWINSLSRVLKKKDHSSLKRDVAIKVLRLND